MNGTGKERQFRKCQYDTKLLCSWINDCESCVVKEYGQMVEAAEREMTPEAVEAVLVEDFMEFDPVKNVCRCIVCGSEIKKED